ncbi:MAG: glycine reductase, partial [Deltaproteobacteria bacterium]|nr:glycine reductase [Deltaproteobacteria bacterium]
MTKHYPVVKNCSYCLIHVPDLVRYGSKPQRELNRSPAIAAELQSHLRSFAKVVAYPPNQTFIGNISPDHLAAIPRPWYQHQPDSETLETTGPFGEIMAQETFYGLLKLADIFNPPFFEVEKDALEKLGRAITAHPLLSDFSDRFREIQSAAPEYLAEKQQNNPCLPLYDKDNICGYFFGDLRSEGKDDENLAP